MDQCWQTKFKAAISQYFIYLFYLFYFISNFHVIYCKTEEKPPKKQFVLSRKHWIRSTIIIINNNEQKINEDGKE